jgi:predicted adenine nucleotide alpha hydrolase (AANH) superfamily ATPase
MAYIEEVALRFEYPYELIDEAHELEKLLDSKKVKFIFYESNGYWKHEFVVRRSGYTWNEIMDMINSVKSAKYKKEKTWFTDEGGEIVFCN